MINTDNFDGWTLENNPENLYLDTVNHVEGDGAIGVTINKEDCFLQDYDSVSPAFEEEGVGTYYGSVAKIGDYLLIGTLHSLFIGKIENGQFIKIDRVPVSQQIDNIYVGNKYIFTSGNATDGNLGVYEFVNEKLTHKTDSTFKTATRVVTKGVNDELVYVSEYTGHTMSVYGFDGESFSFIDGTSDGTTIHKGNLSMDDNYIYIAGGIGLKAYSFNGSVLAEEGYIAPQGEYAYDICVNNGYIFVAEKTFVSVYSFDGVAFSLVDSISTLQSGSILFAYKIKTIENRVVVGELGLGLSDGYRLMVFDFVNETLTERAVSGSCFYFINLTHT